MSDEPQLESKPITYEVADLVALSKLVPRARPQIFRIAAGAIIILLTFAAVTEVWALTGLIDWMAIIASLLVASILLLFSHRRFRAWLFIRFAKRGALYAPPSYAITPSALRISSEKGVSDVRWTAFPDLKRSGDRLFIFMSKRQAFIIPRRAFNSDQDFEAFVNAAEQRWEMRHRL